MYYAESTWWQRNRSWALPGCGCCGCLLLVVFAFVTLVVGGGVAAFSGVRSSQAFTEAMARAKADPRIVEALGEPIETGWLVEGSINITGTSGEADLAIPISGPRGDATVYSVATKSAGEWHFERLEVELVGSERIDLLDRLPDSLPEAEQLLESSAKPIA